MKYRDLRELILNSRSSRTFFLSLPAETQCRLHEYNDFVHSAADLHSAVDALRTFDRQTALGGWPRPW